MLLHINLERFTITDMNAFICLQHVSTDIFNGIFSDATSNIFKCSLPVLMYRLDGIFYARSLIIPQNIRFRPVIWVATTTSQIFCLQRIPALYLLLP